MGKDANRIFPHNSFYVILYPKLFITKVLSSICLPPACPNCCHT